jgi:hypothetical protein
MATPGYHRPRMLGLLGDVLHGGTYHQDWRIEATRRRPPRSGSAALNGPVVPRLVASERPAPVPPVLRRRSSHPRSTREKQHRSDPR